jgi:hypothetical protein
MLCSNLQRSETDPATCAAAPVARWDRAVSNSHLVLCAAHDAAFALEVAANGDSAWKRTTELELPPPPPPPAFFPKLSDEEALLIAEIAKLRAQLDEVK